MCFDSVVVEVGVDLVGDGDGDGCSAAQLGQHRNDSSKELNGLSMCLILNQAKS